MQHQRYVLLAFIVGAILLGLTVQAGSTSIFEQFAIADQRVLGVANVSTLLSLATSVVAFAIVMRTQRAVTYVDEVVDELTKVTWPTREETIRAATTVVFTTLFVATVITAYDFIWKKLADIFLFTES
jgi:preprotein translocase subunit SecE